MYIIGQYVLLFITYSLLGAIGETLFRLVTEGHVYGVHGFLHLPIMPIYGFGALLIVLLLSRRMRHPVLLFVLGALLATALEFIAHWLIEMIFHTRIWDYSQKPFSLDGRISLDNSIGFGFAALILVYWVHPTLLSMIRRIPKRLMIIVASIFAAAVSVDIVVSIIQRLP